MKSIAHPRFKQAFIAPRTPMPSLRSSSIPASR